MPKKTLPHDHGHRHEHLQADIPKAGTFETAAELLKTMSDSRRLQIFWLLCHCEECVINISALLDISSPTASHHLKLLKTAGLIVSRREGKEVYYTAAGTSRAQTLHDMIEQILEVTCPSAESLEESVPYDSSVQTVQEVHALMTADLKKRHRIEDLAQQFHINQTTLKAVFKTVFGQSIAAYMKTYRIKRAMELLAQTDKSVAQIASEVGYENQSKFTQAFKSITGILPKDYRKLRDQPAK